MFFMLSINRRTTPQQQYVTANVSDLMEQKLQALPLEAQMVLQVASCLGCEFGWNTLQLASNAFPLDFDELAREKYKTPSLCLEGVLSRSVEEGVLRRVDPTTYCFVHDQIQAAAFNLVVEEDRQLRTLRNWMAFSFLPLIFATPIRRYFHRRPKMKSILLN